MTEVLWQLASVTRFRPLTLNGLRHPPPAALDDARWPARGRRGRPRAPRRASRREPDPGRVDQPDALPGRLRQPVAPGRTRTPRRPRAARRWYGPARAHPRA